MNSCDRIIIKMQKTLKCLPFSLKKTETGRAYNHMIDNLSEATLAFMQSYDVSLLNNKKMHLLLDHSLSSAFATFLVSALNIIIRNMSRSSNKCISTMIQSARRTQVSIVHHKWGTMILNLICIL
jgi:hypothetical protein